MASKLKNSPCLSPNNLPAQGLVWCLFFNFIGGSALLISDGSQVAAWLWSAIWFVGGVPGAYILWYSRLYNAAIKDSAFGYAIFFAGFFANLVFSIWSAVGACLPAAGGAVFVGRLWCGAQCPDHHSYPSSHQIQDLNLLLSLFL